MKTKYIFTIALAALALTACKKDEVDTTSVCLHTIKATLPAEQTATRTTINDQRQVLWSSGDAFQLIYTTDNSSYSFAEFTLTTGAETTEGTFTSTTIPDGAISYAAVYPASINTTYNTTDNCINITMPAEHNYAENSIAGAPMAALVESIDSNVAFKNGGALLAVTVNNIPAGYYKAILESTGEQYLTGACKITFDDGTPTVTATNDSATNGKQITINFTPDTKATSKTFYFPLPVANYSELQLSISNGTDTPMVLNTAGLNAARNKRYTYTHTITTEVTGANAANEALETGTTSVEVTIQDSETEPTITLPASTNEQTDLTFTAIPTGTTITIKATTENATVAENVAIVAPATNSDNNNFTITLPKSSVTLKAANEAPTTYNEVTAKTAANTLIVSDKVTINNLKVEGGNVRVSASATISAISRVEGNTDTTTYIIYEEGAILPNELGENIVKKSVAEWEQMQLTANVSTQDELNAALKNSAKSIINLPAGEFTIDLYSGAHAKESLTIKGVAGTQVKFANLQARAELFNTLTIDNCEILRMPDKKWGMIVFGSSNKSNGVYTISNCTFNGKGSQGIYINEYKSGAIYNITNCTFDGDFGGEGAITVQNNTGINHTVNVTGCTFNNIPNTSHKIYIMGYYEGWTLNTDNANNVYWGHSNPNI